MIKIEGLIKSYGLNPVLKGVDLHVQAGEFVGLVGANGSGKSTLLKIIAALLTPTAGTIRVGGWPLPERADKVRPHLGYVSHDLLLYPDLTAQENLSFYARLYGLANAEARIAAALKQVGLYTRRYDLLNTFSRGMGQRLALARATLHQPDILLLDEPYTGLDTQGADLLDQWLVEEKERGRTILLITHDIHRGLPLCDRVLHLQRGKLVTQQ
ncbi:MAG: heme ABC exporter ATP-binding protein CcmA [Anaerolineae bacterium]|nr:heme ABC exporter ATP-binding protein CcmA [Anaerolineae bacterium]